MLFISPKKSSFRSQDISIFALTFGYLENLLNWTDKVKFKIYDVTT